MALSSDEQILIRRIEHNKDLLIDLLADLVRINTVNPYSGDPAAGGEMEGQKLLASVVSGLGGSVEFKEPPQDIYQRAGVVGPKGRQFSGRPNLHATFSIGSGPGPKVLVNGHMDTVSATDMTIPPFVPAIRDRALWGRGASDCKAGLAAGLMAIASVAEESCKIRGTLLFDSVVDEECSGSGAGTLAGSLMARKPDAAICLDGEAGRITTGCSGCLTAQLTVKGETAHAASGLGVNAIDKACMVKEEIDRFKRMREQRRPEARVNLGLLRAGVHPAVVPGKAEMQLNIVYESDEAKGAAQGGARYGGSLVMREFADQMDRVRTLDPWLNEHPPELEWIKDLPPYDIPTSHPLVQQAVRCFEDVTQASPVVGPMSAWTDAAWASILEGAPTVLIGPALPGAAHAPDERVLIEDLVTTCKMIGLLLFRLLLRTDV